MSRRKKKKEYDFWLPQDEMEELARTLLPAIRAFFDSDENMKAFKKWEAERQVKEHEST